MHLFVNEPTLCSVIKLLEFKQHQWKIEINKYAIELIFKIKFHF